MPGGIRQIRVALAALLVAAPFLPATAELYRCENGEGAPRFTNDPALCPGAKPHEPEGEVQRIDTPAVPPPRATAPGGNQSPAVLQAQEAAWRAKLEQARRERDELESEVARLSEMMAWCNRGGSVVRRDLSGIPRDVSCEEIRAQHGEKEARLKELRAYLEGGIHEECRRAGCLPGWLRDAD